MKGMQHNFGSVNLPSSFLKGRQWNHKNICMHVVCDIKMTVDDIKTGFVSRLGQPVHSSAQSDYTLYCQLIYFKFFDIENPLK
jgi:hypothetical protein